MTFTREPNYFNRYDRSKRYVEIRTLAGEYPQAAEANERQALLRDLIERVGDTMLQNGDVVWGLGVAETSPGSRTFRTTQGAIWLDGIVHEVDGDVTCGQLPSLGWGFVGIALRKTLVTASQDSTLRDPAVSDSSGNPLGLPGANRLKLVPVWVYGSLATSSLNDGDILQMVTWNDQYDSKNLVVAVDSDESVAGAAVFNAKVSWPRTDTGAIRPDYLTGVKVVSVSRADSFALKKDQVMRGSVKVKNLPASKTVSARLILVRGQDVKLYGQEFLINGAQAVDIDLPITDAQLTTLGLWQRRAANLKTQVDTMSTSLVVKSVSGYVAGNRVLIGQEQVKITQVTAGSGTEGTLTVVRAFGGTTAASHAANDDMYTALVDVDDTISLGVEFTYVDPAMPTNLEFYVADLWVDEQLINPDQIRRPVFTRFANSNGTKYRNFIVGASGGLFYGSPLATDPYNPTVKDYLGIAGQGLRAGSTTDPVLRQGVTTQDQDEDGFRIYPLHLTYNGKLISSLENREFTRITDTYLSELFGEVVSTAAVSGLDVRPGTDADHSASYGAVQITDGQAFIKGRRFRFYGLPPLKLKRVPSSSITSNPPQWGFSGSTSQKFEMSFADPLDLNLEVSVLVKETLTRANASNPGAYEGVDAGRAEYIDPVSFTNVTAPQFCTIRPPDGRLAVIRTTGAQAGTPYTEWKDFKWVRVVYYSDNTAYTALAIEWLDRTAINKGGQYLVYYTFRVKFAGNGIIQPEKDPKTQAYDGFKLYNPTTDVGTLRASTTKLDDQTVYTLTTVLQPLEKGTAAVQGPFIAHNHQVTAFTSTLFVQPGYTISLANQTAFIVWVSGDVSTYGPDGWYGAEPLDSSHERAVKAQLRSQGKLPLALVKVPPTSVSTPNPLVMDNHITAYDLRKISIDEQLAINDEVSELFSNIPMLFARMALGKVSGSNMYLPKTVDDSAGNKDAVRNMAESGLPVELIWTVPGALFPRLSRYKIRTTYFYYGDGSTGDSNSSSYDNGLLRKLVHEVIDLGDNPQNPLNTVVRKIEMDPTYQVAPDSGSALVSNLIDGFNFAVSVGSL